MGYPSVFPLRVIPGYSSYGFPGTFTTGLPRYCRTDRVSPGTNGFFPGTLWVLPCTFVRGTLAPQPFGLVPELGYSPPQRSDFLKSARAPRPSSTLWCVLGPFGFFPRLCLATAPRLSAKLVNFLTILPPGIPSHTPLGF